MTFSVDEEIDFWYDDEIVEITEQKWKEEAYKTPPVQAKLDNVEAGFPIYHGEENIPAKVVLAVLDENVNIIGLYLLSLPGVESIP